MRSRRGHPVIGPDGTEYPSMSAAARGIGVHFSTVQDHLDRYGNLDLCRPHGACVPVVWRGVEYPSVTACAKAAGVARSVVSIHLAKHGHLDRLGTGPGGKRGNRANSHPIMIWGMGWPSKKAAARDLGVHPHTLRIWLSHEASPAQRENLMVAIMAHRARIERKATA